MTRKLYNGTNRKVDKKSDCQVQKGSQFEIHSFEIIK